MSLDTAHCPEGRGGGEGQQTSPLLATFSPRREKGSGSGSFHLFPLLRFRGSQGGLLGPAHLYVPNRIAIVGHSVCMVPHGWPARWLEGWLDRGGPRKGDACGWRSDHMYVNSCNRGTPVVFITAPAGSALRGRRCLSVPAPPGRVILLPRAPATHTVSSEAGTLDEIISFPLPFINSEWDHGVFQDLHETSANHTRLQW